MPGGRSACRADRVPHPVSMIARGLVATVFALALLLRPGAGGQPGHDESAWIGLPAVTTVAASCATTPSIDEAVLLGEVVFVGVVTQVDNGGRWATVRVEERWRGARSLADTVDVHGGPEAGTSTTVDRAYTLGRYLFVVRNGPGYLVDDQCTATTRWVADLGRLRPPGVAANADVVSGASGTQLDLESILPAIALVAALVIAVAAYLVILRARRRPPDWMR